MQLSIVYTNVLKEVENTLQRWLTPEESRRALRLIKGGMRNIEDIILTADL